MDAFEKSVVRLAMDAPGRDRPPAFLRGLGLGAAALSFPDLMAVHAADLRRKNRAMILLWMGGGPSQFETFDPKPDHANGGGTLAIETAVPGLRIAEGWEATARVMKDVAVIRSMTNKEGNHQRASYQLHTGYAPTGTLKHPSLGCALAAELADPKFDLPHIVSIGGGTVGSGFLGQAFEPFVVATPDKPPENMALPNAVSPRRFQNRIALMERLEKQYFESEAKVGRRAGGFGGDMVRDHRTLYNQTRNMVLSPEMKAFDLDGEESSLRDAYGRNPFGQGCLLARRLVETGVTFVEVRLGGWDNHRNIKDEIARPGKSADAAFGTLVADLKSRGLLDSTLVLWMGEFGRTPKVNANAGRDHFPRCFNVALAGGGVKGGQAIGASSADGSEPKDNPVQVNDLFTSVCQALKVTPTKENMSPVGRPIKIVDGGKVVPGLFG